MVLAFHLFNNDLAGQHPVTLFFQVEGNIEVAEILLIKRVFADSQVERAAVTLISLEQGFPQSGFHHLRREFFLLTDVIDQVGEARKKNECHGGRERRGRGGVSER